MSLPNSAMPPPTSLHRSLRWPIRGLNWLLLLIIAGPFAAMQVPSEIGRWEFAQAIELRDQGKKEAAFVKLEQALQRLPESPILLLHRAAWRLEDGRQKEGLEDCQRALELGGERYDVLVEHSQLMQYAGR